MWSPFFERTFDSQFPVAKSPTFVIDSDDDGDHESFCAMLKHIYGMPLREHPDNRIHGWPKATILLDHLVKVYTIADKYDFPSVRRAVVLIIRDYLEPEEVNKCDYVFLRSDLPDLPERISRVCGPNAPQLADTKMRDCFFNWLVYNFGLVCEDPEFKVKLEDGSLFDAALATKLLFRLSERVGKFVRARDSRDSNEDSDDSG
jgi:hypothetical protein